MATFLLIHGQWHDGDELGAGRAGSCARGGTPRSPPTCRSTIRRRRFEDRARPALELAAAAGDDLIVVGHSMASAEAAIVAARHSPSLLVASLPALRRLCGARRPRPRSSARAFAFPPRDAQDRGVWDPDTAIAVMYPRLAPDVARSLAARLRPGANPVGDYPLTAQPDVRTAA